MLAAAEGRRAALPVDEAIAVHRLLSDFVELQHPATHAPPPSDASVATIATRGA